MNHIFLLLLLVSISIGLEQHGVKQQLDASRVPIRIFHFNDAYELIPTQLEPKQGVAYFKSLLDRYRDDKKVNYNISEHTLTFFSGDLFAPSLLSSEYQGQNMVIPLNSLKIDAACYGNHEFDYTETHLQKLISSTNFPWLLSNVIDKRTGKAFLKSQEYKIFLKSGLKIGVFSLVQKQFLDLLIPEYLDKLQYVQFVQYAQKMIKKLKNQQKCDMIIVLSHMIKKNDIKLAQQVNGIDLIFGGHDHLIVHEQVRDTVIVKSGYDFRHFTMTEVQKKQYIQEKINEVIPKEGQEVFIFETQKYKIICKLVEVNHAKFKIVADPEIDRYVNKIQEQFQKKLSRIAIFTKYDIDQTVSTIRQTQQPYLNFIAELYRHDVKADCAMINSGGFREAKVIPAGPILMSSFMNFMKDQIVVKEVNGSGLLWSIQNSLSMYPQNNGRYSQFSKISFIWDCQKQPFYRVIKSSVKINGEPLDENRIYRIALRRFIADGGDGNIVFREAPYANDIIFKQKFLIMQIKAEILDKKEFQNFFYRDRLSIIEENGQKYLQLDLSSLPQFPRVRMINGTANPLILQCRFMINYQPKFTLLNQSISKKKWQLVNGCQHI